MGALDVAEIFTGEFNSSKELSRSLESPATSVRMWFVKLQVLGILAFIAVASLAVAVFYLLQTNWGPVWAGIGVSGLALIIFAIVMILHRQKNA